MLLHAPTLCCRRSLSSLSLTAFCKEHLEDFSSPSFKLGCSLQRSLLLFFVAPAFTLSLPSLLSLTTPNSTDLSNALTCMKVHGEDLNVDSCRNALDKIDRSVDRQQLINRPSEPSRVAPGTVVLPHRYLSDDGLCAIVCCHYFILLL